MSNIEYTKFLTPQGRIIQGHPCIGKDKSREGKAYINRNGEPFKKYFFALAVPKTDPDWPAFIALLNGAARSAWPQLFGPDGKCTLPTFSNKIMDGDSTELDQNGKRWCDKPYHPGHWIIRFESNDYPQLVAAGGVREIPESAIKRGYYVRVSGTTATNGSKKPGMYMNAKAVELRAEGAEIQGEADYSSDFATAPAGQLPPDARPVTPEPNAFASAPAAPGAAPAASAASAPLNTTYMDATPAAPSAPAPAAPAAPTPPAPPLAEPRYSYQGAIYTLSQLVDAGWTPDQIAGLSPVA